MSDDAIRALERELARQGISPEEWAERILGIERDRFFIVSSEPLRLDSSRFGEAARFETMYGAREWFWKTPVMSPQDIIALAWKDHSAGLYDADHRTAVFIMTPAQMRAGVYAGSTARAAQAEARYWAEPLYDSIRLPSASTSGTGRRREPEPEAYHDYPLPTPHSRSRRNRRRS